MRKGHISPLLDQYIAHPFIITTRNSIQHGRHDELVSIIGEAELDSIDLSSKLTKFHF